MLLCNFSIHYDQTIFNGRCTRIYARISEHISGETRQTLMATKTVSGSYINEQNKLYSQYNILLKSRITFKIIKQTGRYLLIFQTCGHCVNVSNDKHGYCFAVSGYMGLQRLSLNTD